MKLQDELIRFSNAHYEDKIIEFNLSHLENNLLEASDDETVKNYIGLIFPWIMLHEAVINQQTIFELFMKQKSSQIHRRKVKEVFSSWKDAISSVFEIISIDDLTEERITIVDLASKQTYKVFYEDIDEDSVGDFIVGTLAPLIQSHTFMYATIQLPREEIDFVYDLVDGFDLNANTMTEQFPAFLGDIFEPYEADLKWPKRIHEEVAQQFAYHMGEKNIDDDIIYSGILFWNHYCVEHSPTVMKTNTYVAALNYFISLVVLEDDSVTQAALAKEYGVSTTSISTHYQKFLEKIKKSQMDELLLNEAPLSREIEQIHQLINEEEFESAEELEAFLAEMLESGRFDDLLEEREASTVEILIEEASEKDGTEQKELLEKVLQLDPDYLPTYILLAEVEKDLERSYDLLTQAIELGEKQLGKQFFVENKGHFWGIFETRPYMIAKVQLADVLVSMKRGDEAISVYEELLTLNPNDNQGVRTLLLSLYIEYKRYEEALRLIKKYNEYPEADFLYSHALVEFLMHGNTNKTKGLLTKAIEGNKYVVDYLTGKKKIPTETIRYIQPGEESEAMVYAQIYHHLWADAIELFE